MIERSQPRVELAMSDSVDTIATVARDEPAL
jgi:hypothetical protein